MIINLELSTRIKYSLKEAYSSYSSTNFRVINFEIPDSNGLKYPMISNSPDSYIHLNPESFPNNLRKNVSKIDIYRPLNERDQIKSNKFKLPIIMHIVILYLENISEIRCKTEMKNKVSLLSSITYLSISFAYIIAFLSVS